MTKTEIEPLEGETMNAKLQFNANATATPESNSAFARGGRSLTVAGG